MRYTTNLKLPLYDYPQDADLTKQYESAMNIIDNKLGVMSSVQAGQGVPVEAGESGSVWIDTLTYRVYVSDGTNWNQVVATSPDEESEYDRPSLWFCGHGQPSSTAQLNDMYLDSTNGDVWQYKGDPIANVEVKQNSDGTCSIYIDSKFIGKNWFHSQGTVNWAAPASSGRADVDGIPNDEDLVNVVLPIGAYVAPFQVKSRIDVAYDLYFHLAGSGFDSGRHFEHHSTTDGDYCSIAEVPIAKRSVFSKCVFTVDPATDDVWTHAASFTTYGLYSAEDYATMLQYGIRWFDADGNVKQDTGWVFVCNIMGNKDELTASDIAYTNYQQDTVGSALDSINMSIVDLTERINRNSSQLDAVKQSIADVSESVSDLQELVESKFESVDGSISSINDSISDLQKQISEIVTADEQYAMRCTIAGEAETAQLVVTVYPTNGTDVIGMDANVVASYGDDEQSMPKTGAGIYSLPIAQLVDSGIQSVTVTATFQDEDGDDRILSESVSLPVDVATNKEFTDFIGL